MRRFLFALFNTFVLATAGRVNYCGAKMCGHENTHTFCQFPEGPGFNCKGHMKAQLSLEDKGRILGRLNQRRSAAASGRLRGLPTAGNMLKLRWIEELAQEAQFWADQCRPPTSPEEHDVCRDLFSISVGQCVASVVGEAPGLRPESMVDMWYMQSMHYKANVTSYEAPKLNDGHYRDFAQILWANTYLVGCARSRFMTSWYGRLRSVERLVCNFAPRGPAYGRALWTPAAPTALCPPRSLPDSDLPALCTFQHDLDESYDIDNAMSLEEHILLTSVLNIERNESLNYLGGLDELYLTQLAIATMANAVTTSSYNSVQKRDVIEKDDQLDQDANIFELIKNITEQEQNMTANVTKHEEITTPIVKLTKQKGSVVGRPKSYKIDELNEIGDDHDHILNNELDLSGSIQDIPNNENDIYVDYEFSESTEEISSATLYSTTTINENITRALASGNITEELKRVTTARSVEKSDDNITTASSYNETMNGTTEINDKSIEDYLSDPETVRQIQQELDRMENALSTSLSTSGKVRRELREYPKETDVNNNIVVEDNTPPPEIPEPIKRDERNNSFFDDVGNKTEDKTTMFNMVMRYMPYLKEYKNNILKSATSKSNCMCPSIILAISFCI